uniref:Alpha-galactosidase n=1 Tax=Kalanchoe fedtschenkoi TaxID=63787 RepID=A0A7N0UAP0_KALFE
MATLLLLSYSILASLLLAPSHQHRTTTLEREVDRARIPPRGWNSYDSYSWIISEREFLQNAQLVAKHLKPFGYEYVVVDYLWYRRKVEGAYSDSLGYDVIDEWGRMLPDPARWPSSRGGKGFAEVAKKVHDMGLKFGIHVMRGISTQAVNANTPIFDSDKGGAYEESGRRWRAGDIGMKERKCAWMPNGFMSVNLETGAGKAFVRSLYRQYAEWGVDFVKHDCVFGEDFDLPEITYVSKVLAELDRPILYSLSPGTSVTPAMAKQVSGLANMYRITGDDWDNWGDVASHFNISRDMAAAEMIGTGGLMGKSWPDLDMLPLGWLTNPGSNEGSHRLSNLSLAEQQTQMTLWSIAKSPLMFGGDMIKLDEKTLELLTNPALLEMNLFSSYNMEFPYVSEVSRPKSPRPTDPPTRLIRETSPDVLASGKRIFHLQDCTNPGSNGWSESSDGRVCWNRNGYLKPICFHKRRLGSATNEEKLVTEEYDGKHHLTVDGTPELCLDAASEKKLTAGHIGQGSVFSRCRLATNQMWELADNGMLVNSYAGLCATVETYQGGSEIPPPIPTGARSWMATGRSGEIYLAYFNLNERKTVISAKLSDLAGVLRGRNIKAGSCSCREVWSGRNLGTLRQALAKAVEPHGCLLFVLKCL